MAKLTRHVGRLTNSGVRCAVVFRTLPDEPENCLIVETDALSDMLQDDLMKVIEGRVAQEEIDLYKALERSRLSGGVNALSYLHQAGHIKKVPVANVEMMPLPNRPVPLVDINAQIDGNAPVEEVVTASKKARLAKAARYFLLTYNITDRPCRFDVVTIILGQKGREQIRHYKNIFTP